MYLCIYPPLQMKILLSNPYGLKTKGKFFNQNSITNQNMKMYQYCKIQYILSNKYMISHEEKEKKNIILRNIIKNFMVHYFFQFSEFKPN